MRKLVIGAAALLLAGCGPTDTDPGPGGVTVGEARALDQAADMLDEQRLLRLVRAIGLDIHGLAVTQRHAIANRNLPQFSRFLGFAPRLNRLPAGRRPHPAA